jgi:hypothetical protein
MGRAGRLLAAALALASAALLRPAPAAAASFDPDLTWRTLETAHFTIHFHGGLEQLAEETAKVAEEAWVELTAELRWAPRARVQVVLVDNTDSANGYAMTVPQNTIVIYVTAPTEDGTLSRYRDWNDAIFTHELTHILHIDLVRGLPKALRYIFGRVVSVNRVTPGWLTEGYATLMETRYTPEGRGRSSYPDMLKRVAVIEGKFPPLGNLEGFQVEPPSGNLRYLFGQDFQAFVVEQAGPHVWTDFHERYGAGIPYLMPAKKTLGDRIPKLYEGWRAAMTARYEAQAAAIRSSPLVEPTLLSDGVDQCAAPTFSPDGARLVWSCYDPEAGPAIFLADGAGQGARRLLDQRFAGDFAWRPDGEAFAFSALHLVDRFNSYNDLYFYALDGQLKAMTNGERARAPAWSPDGSRLTFVANEAQHNRLRTLTVDQRVQTLVDPPGHTQLGTPRYSPDGRHIVASVWFEGQRDLWLYTAEGAPVRRLMADDAEDIDPVWSPDGRRLYWSSDRGGVYNIWTVDLQSEHLHQVTNVLGGVFAPSLRADGQLMAMESYSNNGMDVGLLPVDPRQWLPKGKLSPPADPAAPLAPLAAALPAPDFRPLGQAPLKAADDVKDVSAPDIGRKFRIRRGSLVPAHALPFEPPRIDGLHGLGGPLYGLRGVEGPWGLPGEDKHPGSHAQPTGPTPTAGPVADAPTGGVAVDDPTRTRDGGRAEKDYPFTHPVARYSPLHSLAPRYVLPGLSLTQLGVMGSLATAGTDVLRQWAYSGFVSYQTDADFIGGGGAVSLNRFIPVYTVGAYTSATYFGDLYRTQGLRTQPGGMNIPSLVQTDDPYWERRITGYGQVSWPLNEYQGLFVRYSIEDRDPKDPLGDDVYRPTLPTRGLLSSVGMGWTLYRGRSFLRSISAEQARALSLSGNLSSSLLGSSVLNDNDQPEPFDRLQLMAELREYRSLPWGQSHVFAARLAGGASFGDQLRQGSFRLGGTFGESAVYTLPTELRPLRGFPVAVVSGDGYVLGSAEYRLPVVWVDRGAGLLPVYLRNVSAAAFVDAGDAFQDPAALGLDSLRVGAGAELQARLIVAWAAGLTARAGYGVAVAGEGGYVPGDLGGAYFSLGGSF